MSKREKELQVRVENGMEKHTFCLDYNVGTCNGSKNWATHSGTQEIPSIPPVQLESRLKSTIASHKCSSAVHALYLVKMWLDPGMEIKYQLLTCKMTPILIFSWLWTFHFLL